MATHSSVPAWRIPGWGSLVGCRLWGCTESDTTEVTQQQCSSLAMQWRFYCRQHQFNLRSENKDLAARMVQPKDKNF